MITFSNDSLDIVEAKSRTGTTNCFIAYEATTYKELLGHNNSTTRYNNSVEVNSKLFS